VNGKKPNRILVNQFVGLGPTFHTIIGGSLVEPPRKKKALKQIPMRKDLGIPDEHPNQN
jgi:hypothetical protein